MSTKVIQIFSALSLVCMVAGCQKSAKDHYESGDAHFERKEYQLALTEYQEAERLDPSGTQALRQLGFTQSALGNRPEAMQFLERYRDRVGFDSTARLTLAQLYMESGRPADALKEAEFVLKRTPESRPALNIAGSANLATNRPAEAVANFSKLATLEPKEAAPHYSLGVALTAQKDMAQAAREFDTALTLSPGYMDPLTMLVQMDMAAKRFDAALARVNRQMKIAGDSAAYHEMLADVQLATGKQELAEQSLLRAIELDAHAASAYGRLSEIYIGQGKPDPAGAILAKGIAANPDNANLQVAQGVLYEALGNPTAAKSSYEAGLKSNPHSASAASNLATLLTVAPQNLDRALQLANIAIASDPSNPAVLDTYGWVLMLRGDYPASVKALSMAASMLPNQPTVAYHLGAAYAKSGDTASARKQLAKAVASRMGFPEKAAAEQLLRDLK